jgi:glycosyltransferase involved in cell wall biosynthesis
VKTKPIKILLISVRSDIGGGPKHLLDLANGLVKSLMFEVTIAAPNEKPFFQLFSSLTDNIITIPKRRFSILKFLQILIHCKSREIQLVHSHGRGAGIYSRPLSCFGIKVVHTFHGIHKTPNLTGTIKIFTDRILRNLTHQFICVSKDEKKIALAHEIGLKEIINVVENGVDIEKIHKKDRVTTETVTTFGMLARLNYQKGIDLALEFISKINFPFKLLIAGDGEDEEELKKTCNHLGLNEKVSFIGPVSRPQDLFDQVDAYLSTARWEGLPLSVLEAMSYPLPCLLSKVTGHIQLASEDSVVLFDLDNPESLISGIKELKKNKGHYEKEGLRYVRKNHSIELMLQKTIEVYKKTLSSE